MFKTILALCIASASAFVPPVTRLPISQAAALERNVVMVAASNPFGDIFSGIQKLFNQEPELTLEEMRELCRDDESVGCDVDMIMNADLMAAHKPVQKKMHIEVVKGHVQWTGEE